MFSVSYAVNGMRESTPTKSFEVIFLLSKCVYAILAKAPITDSVHTIFSSVKPSYRSKINLQTPTAAGSMLH